MEEDHEVLDWGNEEDEQHHEPLRTPSYVEDADDAVSLGDEEDDDVFYPHQAQENGSNSEPSTTVKVAESFPQNTLGLDHFQDLDVDESSHSQQVAPREEPLTSSTTQADVQNDSSQRLQNLLQPRLTHALPPKPVAASLPYLPPSHPSIVEATAMSARAREYKRSSGSAEKPSSHHKDQLPPNWEIRHPRSGGRTVYYYNIVTHQSTWHHPGQPTPSNRTKSGSNSSKPVLVDSYVPQSLSYEDRHYRPGDSPDLRRDDRANDGSELRPATPPMRSPPSREHLRSCSPPPPRDLPMENLERLRSNRSDRDADLRGDSSHQSRNDSLPVSGTHAPRQTTSKLQNESSSGHSNRETFDQQLVPINLVELPSLANEDRLSLSRSNSTRGDNSERIEHDLSHDTVEARQGPNHSLSLSSSRPLSPSPLRDREWVPTRREQCETELTQSASTVSAKTETTPRPALASRRDRPSRFDRPLSTAVQIPPLPPAPSTAIEQTASRHTSIPADMDAPHEPPPPDSKAGRDSTRPPQYSPIQGSRIADRWSPPDDKGPNRQMLPIGAERAPPVFDQSGPPSRRRRAPLPPQAASFREETSRRRDHDTPRTATMRSGVVPFPTMSQGHHSDAHSSGTSSHETSQSVSHARVELHVVEHRNWLASDDGQYAGNNRRRGDLSVDNEHPARVHPQTRAHPSIDASMDIDIDRLPSSSPRVLSRLPSQVQGDDAPHRPASSLPSRSSTAGPTPSIEASVWHPPGDLRRQGLLEDFLEQSPSGRLDHAPRNERTFHERPDRHGLRRESRGRPNEHKATLSGSVPKLTGPNSVPIGIRRQTSFHSDMKPAVVEYAIVPRFPVEQPHRPSIAPGKESYERPSYDNYPVSHQEPNPSPPSYKRAHQPEPVNAVIPDLRVGRIVNEPRSRFDQPLREHRNSQPPHESLSRTRSPSSERISTRDRQSVQWQPPQARTQAQRPPSEFSPGNGMPPRNVKEDRQIRLGKQNHYRERLEGSKTSPVDDFTGRLRRPDIKPTSFDGHYGDRTTEHPPLLPSSNHGSDRNHCPPSRQQRPPERARSAEILTPNATATSSERRTRRGELHEGPPDSSFPESPEHRVVRRLGVVDRYEPDYNDGFPSVPQRRRPRLAKEDSQRGEPSHRDDAPYHDHEISRPSVRPLLDRLSFDTEHPSMSDPVLRNRVKIPEKRDRNEVDHDFAIDIPFEEAVTGPGAGEPVPKRARRRTNRMRRGKRGSGGQG